MSLDLFWKKKKFHKPPKEQAWKFWTQKVSDKTHPEILAPWWTQLSVHILRETDIVSTSEFPDKWLYVLPTGHGRSQK